VCELFVLSFVAFLSVSQQSTRDKGSSSSKTQQKIMEKVRVKNFLQIDKGIRENKTFFLSFVSFGFVLSRFWPFLCMTSSKTPWKCFPKSDVKISKNLKRR
jgi:hypothetical protein